MLISAATEMSVIVVDPMKDNCESPASRDCVNRACTIPQEYVKPPKKKLDNKNGASGTCTPADAYSVPNNTACQDGRMTRFRVAQSPLANNFTKQFFINQPSG